MKEYKLKEDLIVYLENENEEFGLISFNEPFTFWKDYHQDYFVFNDSGNMNHYNLGQMSITINLKSLQEYLEVMSYLVKKGWINNIKKRQSNNWDKLFFWSKSVGKDKKKYYNLEKIREETEEGSYHIAEYNYYFIGLRLNWKDLERFRNDFLSIPGYKVVWLDLGVKNGFDVKRYYIK